LLYYGLRGGSYDIVPRQEEAMVVWWILGITYALGLLPRAKPPRGALVPLAALALLALWTAIGLGFTESGERTFAELARYLHYVGLLLLVWATVDARTWKSVAAGLLAGAVALCAIGLASRLWPSAFPTDYVVVNYKVNRLSYPFNYWNAVGAFAVMSIAMALIWSAHGRLLWIRAAALACVPICASTAYLTYSRAAVIGAAGAMVLVLLLSRNRWVAFGHILAAAAGSVLPILAIRSHKEIADATGGGGAWVVLLVLIAGCAIAAAGACATWFLKADGWRVGRRTAWIAVVVAVLLVPAVGHSEISKGWNQFRTQPSAPPSADPAARLSNLNGNRYFIWRSAVRAFKKHPIDGTGAGTFGFWWSRTGGDEFLRDAHSLYFESIAEQGVFGGLLILVFLVGLAVAAVRARFKLPDAGDIGPHAALLAAFFVFLFHAGVDWMWESTTVTVLALLAIATAAAATSRPAAAPARLPVRLGVTAFAIVAFLVQLPGLASTLQLRDSQAAFKRGDVATAISKANQSINSEPWAASPYAQRALVEEAQGHLGAARSDLIRAERREPTNYQHPLLLARVEAELGNTNAALASYRRAKELRPLSPLVTPTSQR
jgi:tetratricopeptide (TPR) repeat protein